MPERIKIPVNKAITGDTVFSCLVSTIDAFDGYNADRVLDGIRDFVVVALLAEGVSIDSFCEELERRNRDLITVIKKEAEA